jgi:hypothetical protein
MVTKKSRRVRTPNPTLHGLIISRNFSGTVVRGLLFAILAFGFVLVGTGAAGGVSGGSALLTWLVMTIIYVIFDILYVLMSLVRPLHPRLDRVVLPGALIFSLIAVFMPLVYAGRHAISATNLWMTAVIFLVFILGVRFALLIASKK